MCDCEPREGGHCEECMIADREMLARQDALLRGVVDAIRGPHPDPLTRWGVHDAPELAAALVAERDRAGFFDVLFDGPPAHVSGRFVEVEDENGKSIRVGRWIDRGDGLWALRIGLRESALETALRELVEDIDDTKRNAGELTVAVAFHRTNCPKCDEDPEESIGLCPYHAAKALLGGAA